MGEKPLRGASSTEIEEAVRAVLVEERYVLDVGDVARSLLASLASGDSPAGGRASGERLRDLARRAVRARLYPSPRSDGDEPPIAGFDAATVRATHAAFNRRSREDRELLWASEIEGRPPGEIAQERGRPERQVRAALRAARRRFVDDFRRTMRRCAPRRGGEENAA